jgi:hypothetical protein
MIEKIYSAYCIIITLVFIIHFIYCKLYVVTSEIKEVRIKYLKQQIISILIYLIALYFGYIIFT